MTQRKIPQSKHGVIRLTNTVLDACARVGISSWMIDNYPTTYINRLVKAFNEENKA